MLIALLVILILLQFFSMLFVIWQFGVAVLGIIQIRQKPGPSEPKNKFAILVCAHNEENAISALLESLEVLDYPKALYHTYVFADHCTDNTANVARAFHGVTVMERNEGPQNGKGDVLAWGLDKVLGAHPNEYDAFTIFDADNVADPAFLTHMNESLNKGEDVIQGNRLGGEPYRSIITQWYAIYWACYSVLFSYSRQKLGLSCFLTGTGFTVRRDILQKYGWKTKSITEDVEFAIQHALRNRRVAFNIDAVCYDEQPSNFFVMLKQICRWCTGSYQILGIYLGDLVQRFGKTRSVKLLDNIILLFLGPATVLGNILTIIINVVYISTFQHARLFQIIFIVLSLAATYIMTRMTTKFANIPFKKLLPGFFLFPISEPALPDLETEEANEASDVSLLPEDENASANAAAYPSLPDEEQYPSLANKDRYPSLPDEDRYPSPLNENEASALPDGNGYSDAPLTYTSFQETDYPEDSEASPTFPGQSTTENTGAYQVFPEQSSTENAEAGSPQ